MFGILDVVPYFVLALFVPSPLAYPAVTLPALLVPLSLDCHGLSLRQLTRAIKREGRPATALAD
ncbi:MAG: hypothetical protein ACLQJR_29060 [Stellaceae bacterium]